MEDAHDLFYTILPVNFLVNLELNSGLFIFSLEQIL